MNEKPTYEQLKQRVQELERSNTPGMDEDWYRLLFNSTNDAVFVHQPTITGELQAFIEVNDTACKLYGYSKTELLKLTPADLMFGEQSETVKNHINITLSEGKNIFSVIHKTKSGKELSVEISSFNFMLDGQHAIMSIVRDVSERKQLESALQDSEEKYRVLFDQSLMGIYLHDLEGRILDVNHVACIQSGYTKEELLSFNVFNLHPDVEGTQNLKINDIRNLWKLWEPGERHKYEGEHQRKDGIIFPIEASTGPINYKGEKYIVAIVQDITERKNAENVLRESETKYRELFESNTDGIIRTDLDGVIEEVNPAFLKMVGYDDIDDLKKTYQELTPEKWHSFETDIVTKQVFARGYSDEYEKEYIRKDGTIFPISIKIWLVSDKKKPIGMWGIVRDITERKLSEKLILKNQYYLTKAQEIGKIGTWQLDIQKNNLIWTDENYKIFGVPRGSEMTYELFLNCVHPDDRDYVNRKWNAALNHQPYDIMHRLIVNNKVKWVREKADIEFDAGGYPVTAIGFTQDLTDLKQIEDALRESERRFETMFEQAPLSYQSLDENGNFTEVNQTWLQTMGYARNEVLGKNFSEFLVPEWKSHFANNFPRFKAVGEVLGVEFEMVKKDGSNILVSFHGKIGKNPDGSFKQTHCIFHDITRLRHFEKEKEILEQKMLQIQKIESIGNLAGGIAHDFNNLLSPIIGMSEMLLEDLPKDSPEHENAREIFHAGRRAGELVNQILAFSRQSEHRMMPVHIQNVLNEVLKLTRSTIPVNIEIKHNIQQDCGLVMADTTQIHQIAMNLITNAYHAVEDENGVITIELDETMIDETELIDKNLVPGKYVKLSVSDNGIGMAQSTISKIFEPYFTTKEKGKGTGLGLAVVYGIVKEHKGDITVYSEIGRGTNFSIYLPLMKKNREAVSAEQASELETGTEKILLIDDEVSVAKLEGKMLSRLGYDVTVKTDSEDALKIFQSNSDSFDLVISDMTMPNLTGDQLAKKILSIRPEIPIIICTGFSERINKEKAQLSRIKDFLLKPIVKSELARMVRKVLDEAKFEKQQCI